MSMEFSRQEYWSGLPFPFLEDLPDPGMEPMSLASPTLQAGSLPTEPSGKDQQIDQWKRIKTPETNPYI